jgi:transcriptional regulator with XRE-family HTH domain
MLKERGIELDVSSLYAFEKGRSNMSLPRLLALAELYEVSIDWILGRTENRIVASNPIPDLTMDRLNGLAELVRVVGQLPAGQIATLLDVARKFKAD